MTRATPDELKLRAMAKAMDLHCYHDRLERQAGRPYLLISPATDRGTTLARFRSPLAGLAWLEARTP